MVWPKIPKIPQTFSAQKASSASVVRVLDHCFFSSSFCAINYRLLLPCVWFISRTGNKNWPVSQHLVMPSNANQIKIEHNVFPAFVIKMPDGLPKINRGFLPSIYLGLVLVQFQKYRQLINNISVFMLQVFLPHPLKFFNL